MTAIPTAAGLAGALCAGEWALFDSTDQDDHMAARAMCAACPVYDQCRALVDREIPITRRACTNPTGTWAGQLYGSAQSRYRALPRACGTDRGYYQHRYRGEEACAMCRKAHNAANRTREAS